MMRISLHFLVCMRGGAGYIHEYAKDLGMNDDEAVYPLFYLRHYANESSSLLHDLLGLQAITIEELLIFPIILFSGTQPQPLPDKPMKSTIGLEPSLTALSWGGICSHVDGLRQLSSQPDQVWVIHVTPGHIQRQVRQYSAIYDRPSIEEVILRMEDFNELDSRKSAAEMRSELRATVGERSSSRTLTFSYEVAIYNKPKRFWVRGSLPPFQINPGLIAMSVLRRACLIPCSISVDCPPSAPFACQNVPPMLRIPSEATNDKLSFYSGVACTTFSYREEDEIDRCIAIALHMMGRDPVHSLPYFFIRRHECFPCSIRAAISQSRVNLKELQRSGLAPENVRVVYHFL